jgi:ubiquinone/menaquinone biosynthesis C-methylase UbiE
MGDKQLVLTSSEARAFYDRFGARQDSQGFYEEPALDDLIAHARFSEARKVFEFGCGTGAFAERLLAEYLPSSATYLGCDISPVMIQLASRRLKAYAERVKLVRADGAVSFPVSSHSVDRIISSYVLDLLSEEDTRLVFAEAHRVLVPGGMLCLASITEGVTLPSRIVSLLWTALFRMRASLVGGCRPVRLEPYIDQKRWQLEHRRILTPFGVPSEAVVLSSKITPDEAEP